MAKLPTWFVGFGGILKRFSFTVLRLLLTFLLFLSSPVIILFYSGVCLYRFTVFKWARYLDPELGKMVSSISNFFAAHDIYGNSYVTNIGLQIDGEIDKFHVISALAKLLEARAAPDGPPLYPELKQKIVYKLGFTFWKNVGNFEANSHIHYYKSSASDSDDPVTLEDLRVIIAKFGKTPMDPSRSPWEVFIIKNFLNEEHPSAKSVIILRLHHCMFDGHSVLNVFSRVCDNGPLVLAGIPPQQPPVKRWSSRWWLQILVRPLMIFFLAPYELVGQLLMFDDNELVQTSRSKFNSVVRFHECDPIHLGDLKQVKNHFGVGFNTVVTSVLVGAIRKFMEGRKITPKKIHMTFPLPYLNHPDKLRNYFSGGLVSFDMRLGSRLELLQAVEKKFQRFRYSFAVGLPEMSMLLLRILGSLPCFLVPKIDNVPLSSTLMHSSFPGPVEIGYFCGFPVVDATVGGSIGKPYPLSTLCFSYNGVYKIGLFADTSVLSQEGAEELGRHVQEEFSAFQRNMREAQV